MTQGDVDTLTWFGNLLSEGDLQNAVARCLGSSTGDVFGMLTDLGEECIGAINLLSQGKASPEVGHYQPSPEDEFFALVSAPAPASPSVSVDLLGTDQERLQPQSVDHRKIFRKLLHIELGAEFRQVEPVQSIATSSNLLNGSLLRAGA